MKQVDRFNPSTYMVIDRVTGEEVNLEMFIEKASENGWQKAYAKTVAEYIKCGDGKSVDFLAYLLGSKDDRNMIYGTQRELSKACNVSLAVVTRTMKVLVERDMIKKVRSGTYMLSPKIMRYGGKAVGAIMLRMWGEI